MKAGIGGTKVLLIAHRGNVFGPQPELENNPIFLNDAISKGYMVETDVWYINNKLYLGHDEPRYHIEIDYLKNEYFWCHCKNVEALKYLFDHGVHCFFHKQDDVTLTSKGYIWTFPKKKLVPGSVCVLPEYGYDGDLNDCAGVCSDYVEDFKNKKLPFGGNE